METFFFYDLETSGLSPREDRIMQFAGIRTDKDLKPLGQPINLLVKLANDTLPSPGAIMVTKITPQQTLADGLSEAEFCNYVENEIFIPGTCAIGYNSVRFDDEFMRHTSTLYASRAHFVRTEFFGQNKKSNMKIKKLAKRKRLLLKPTA